MGRRLDYLNGFLLLNEAQEHFEGLLAKGLNLVRVPCPLFVKSGTGLQDGLTGFEKPVTFEKDGEIFEVVHSLAKWKREALFRYNFSKYMGIYTNMKAIRKDENVDCLHSLLVDQWDWERIICREDRNLDYLKSTVDIIYGAIVKTSSYLSDKFSVPELNLPDSVSFIKSEDLYDLYPGLCPGEREGEFCKNKKAVFIIGVGRELKNGEPHDLRSPDYDDWDLNGDLILYSEALDDAVEISSMGIRVDKISLMNQLNYVGIKQNELSPYHKKIITEELPYTIGGGIGQSRLLMFLLNRTHIAQVQASSWDKSTESFLKQSDVIPL